MWGTGVFEGDDQEAFAEKLCRPLLRGVEAVLCKPASLPRRRPKTIDLLLCRMVTLAALVELVSRANRQYPAYGPGRLFPCELPSPNTLAQWRSDFFAEWEHQAAGWVSAHADLFPEVNDLNMASARAAFVQQLAEQRHAESLPRPPTSNKNEHF
jgi:hypothetical protein